jgi:hypothetical protein
MKISNEHVDEDSLAEMAIEAMHLLTSGDFSGLAERYGYTLAFGRQPSVAIAEDFSACLLELQAMSLSYSTVLHPPKVTFLEENEAGIFATVEITAHTTNGRELLVEFVATYKGEDKYITLEQLSAAT